MPEISSNNSHLKTLLILGIWVIIMGSPYSAFAQQLYSDSLYSRINRKTLTYYSKPNEDLKLDIFNPVENKRSDRPMLLYVHGGGFSGGERDHPDHIAFSRHMASKGYVAATMDYTLQRKGKAFGCDLAAHKKIETFLKTARDISRAVAYLVEHHEKFGIDTTRIVILGSSAGAEAVMHAAYWEKSRKDDNGVILPDGFEYAGVVSMAGAIADIRKITRDNAIPTQLFHGTCDTAVPYGEAPHHYCKMDTPGFLTLYGGYAIMKRLHKLDKGYYLVTGKNGGHEWNSLPIKSYRDKITNFIYHDVLLGEKRQIHTTIETGKPACPDLGK